MKSRDIKTNVLGQSTRNTKNIKMKNEDAIQTAVIRTRRLEGGIDRSALIGTLERNVLGTTQETVSLIIDNLNQVPGLKTSIVNELEPKKIHQTQRD